MGRGAGGSTYGRSGFEVEDSRAVIAAGRSTLGTGDVSVSMSIMARREISTMLYKKSKTGRKPRECRSFNFL